MLTKNRLNGAVAELLVTADFTRKGYSTYSPTIENTECDLVVDVDGKLFKVQVKSGHSDGTKLQVDLRRPSAKQSQYDKDAFDILAICDLTTGKLAYLIWPNIPYKSFITLRITDTPYANGFTETHGRLMFTDFNELPLDELRAIC